MTIRNLTIHGEQGHWKARSRVRFSLLGNVDPTAIDRAAAYRALLPAVVRSVRDRIGVEMDASAPAWGTKTGCSCGCSPGFVLEGDRSDLLVRVEVECVSDVRQEATR